MLRMTNSGEDKKGDDHHKNTRADASHREKHDENGADKVAQRRRGQKGRRNQRGAPEVEEVRLDLHKDEDGWPES